MTTRPSVEQLDALFRGRILLMAGETQDRALAELLHIKRQFATLSDEAIENHASELVRSMTPRLDDAEPSVLGAA